MHAMMTVDDAHRLVSVIEGAPDDAQFVEYGGGGSTKLFAQHLKPTQTLFTIEHNPQWYARIVEAVADVPNVVVTHRTVTVTGAHPFAHPSEESPAGCADYIHARGIPIEWSRVAMVLVDGIARGPVTAVVRHRVPARTPVFIHDYVGREEWYEWAVALFDSILWPEGSSEAVGGGGTFPNSLITLEHV